LPPYDKLRAGSGKREKDRDKRKDLKRGKSLWGIFWRVVWFLSLHFVVFWYFSVKRKA
jgi:hypothetical protein